MSEKYKIEVTKNHQVRFTIGVQTFTLESIICANEDNEQHARWMAEMLDKALKRLTGEENGENKKD